jgi:hypothetical protein
VRVCDQPLALASQPVGLGVEGADEVEWLGIVAAALLPVAVGADHWIAQLRDDLAAGRQRRSAVLAVSEHDGEVEQVV